MLPRKEVRTLYVNILNCNVLPPLILGRRKFDIDCVREGYAPTNKIGTCCHLEYYGKDYLQWSAETSNGAKRCGP